MSGPYRLFLVLSKRLRSVVRRPSPGLRNAPPTLTAPQLRVLLRVFITIDAYSYSDDVATYYVGDDDNNQQSAEEIPLSVPDWLEDDQVSQFALRPALATHPAFPVKALSTTWPRQRRSLQRNSQRRDRNDR